ncbi:AraC-like DNA-binding protein [Microbulbifer hydrolyticus]|uniref:AraC-like DNA-binding protein n=1 Tax=Microbulbifer hydrolyticus TaxID=48074 RepID=A0AA89PS52_9GAMM|nr:AraC-like DNA-binding protein [Microbulbifer hydrolyticus]
MVEDIAYKTGFSEASAFIRAFKGWTGVRNNTNVQ